MPIWSAYSASSRDVGDELVRRPRVVLVVIVAQREIAEVHAAPPVCPMVTFLGCRHYRCICNCCKCK